MTAQIKPLIKLELSNLFGINVYRHTRDRKEKKLKTFLAGIIVFVVIMLAGYTGGQSYGLIWMGMENLVFAYLTVLASMLILIMDFLKAGNLIFQKNGYDIIASLPLSQTTIVCSRFARMYVENMLVTAIVFLPGIGVYGAVVKPGWSVYVLGLTGMLMVPLIPMSVAVFGGALIKAVSSRMKYKSMAEIVLSLALVVAMLLGSFGMSGMEGNFDPEALKELSGEIYAIFEKIYPPAAWLGSAVTEGLVSKWFLFAGVSIAVMGLTIGLVSFRYHAICRGLFGTSAKHNYQMQALSQDSLLVSLCKRELKRYVSSGVYVTNTIIGPIMGVAAAVAILVMGIPAVLENIPVQLNLYGCVPFFLGTIFCMMNPACVSISMEGKNWWIVKSLPLETRTILDAKMLMSLILYAPFYAVSVILLLIALKPGVLDAFWILFVPLLFILFGTVLGITVNLHLPLMDWDNEVRVVKQSASSVVGGMGGVLVSLVCVIAVVAVPEAFALPVKLVVCALILGATVILYRKNARTDLGKIG